jgi:hypothetical protein
MSDTRKRGFLCPMTDEPCQCGDCTSTRCVKLPAAQWSAEQDEKERLLRAYSSTEWQKIEIEIEAEREAWEAALRG